MSNPALGAIGSIPWPIPGTTNAPGPGSMSLGINGPGVPGVEWAPRGGNPEWSSILQSMANGMPPVTHGHVTLRTQDFVSQQYSSPEWGDESDKYMSEGMICFAIRSRITQNDGPYDVMIMSLPMVNYTAHDEWRVFKESVNAGNTEDVRFYNYLREYGEQALETYHKLKESGSPERMARFLRGFPKATAASDLAAFHDDATKLRWTWLTKFGILNRINYIGTVNNLNCGTSLPNHQPSSLQDAYRHITAGLAKRLRLSNIFGDNEHVQTGSKLWR